MLSGFADRPASIPVKSPRAHQDAAGIGKSTVGWQVYMKALEQGTTTAFIDLDQIGFLRPTPDDNHHLKAENLASLWTEFCSAGAKSAIIVGPVDHLENLRGYREALPETELTVCRLHAAPEVLRHRILGRGKNPSRLPGDALFGKFAEALHRIADRAIAVSDRLERNGIGDSRVDTSGLTAEDAAGAVPAATSPSSP